jgi:TonB family protein
MNNLVCSVASFVANSVWEVPLIAGAGWLVSRWVKRLGPRVEHVVWVSTLALAVLTPALPLWRWLRGLLYGYAGIDGRSSITFFAADSVKTKVSAGALLTPAVIEVLLLLYGIALLYFSARLGRSLYLTVRLRREASPMVLEPDKAGVWNRCRRALSLEDAMVMSSTQVAGPVAIGFREPVLLLPYGFSEECSVDDFLAAVAHECAHLKRRDFQKNLLYEVVSLVIAFHPATWILKSQIAQTREMICDGVATEELIDSDAYTESLLRLATMVSLGSRVTASHAIGIFDANILEKRVMTINTKRQRHSVFMKYGLIAPAALLLLSVAAGAGAMAVAIAPPTTAKAADQDKPYGPVYKVGQDVSAPKLISSVQPEFPQSARGEHDKWEGRCLVGLVVDETGMPQDVHIVRSLRQDFDEKSIEAVRQYRFQPAMKAGTPVAVSLKVEVKFARF